MISWSILGIVYVMCLFWIAVEIYKAPMLDNEGNVINKQKTNNMENKVLFALTEFTLNNYERLKREYNNLTQEQKATTPITIYIVKTFDLLLKNSIDELKITTTPTQVDAD